MDWSSNLFITESMLLTLIQSLPPIIYVICDILSYNTKVGKMQLGVQTEAPLLVFIRAMTAEPAGSEYQHFSNGFDHRTVFFFFKGIYPRTNLLWKILWDVSVYTSIKNTIKCYLNLILKPANTINTFCVCKRYPQWFRSI